MDFLDPQKRLRHTIIMLTGYILIGVAIIIGTIVLLYQAYGFGVNRSGTVIQNGLLFFSSQPRPADIYINNKLSKYKTNTRLVLPSGLYTIRLEKAGYHSWQRAIELDGGSVAHFDYPMLFPKNLVTTSLQTYETAPGVATQSLDRRWVIAAQAGSMTSFDVYDLKNPAKQPVVISLPADLLTKASTSESWQFSEWADDNQHVVLQHMFDGKSEYILLDRATPASSVNLNQTLSAEPVKLTLNDKKYDQYYLLDGAGTLQSASLKATTPVTALSHVLAYQSYGNDAILYATADAAPTGKVLVKYVTGDQTYTIRSVPVSATYLLNLAKYSGTFYFAVGASSESKVYVYNDPVGQLTSRRVKVPSPVQVLHVENPNYLAFSSNAQFIMAEGNQQFGVYDFENKRGYNFQAKLPLDAPLTHASWMDGNRLDYVSGGKLVVFDYDGLNQQSLAANGPAYQPFFAPDFQRLFTLAPTATPSQYAITQTLLVVQ